MTVSAVHYNPTIERWEFVVGSEVWGDYDTEAEALDVQADYEAEQKVKDAACAECGGHGSDPLNELKPCGACGGSGKDCSGVEVRHG